MVKLIIWSIGKSYPVPWINGYHIQSSWISDLSYHTIDGRNIHMEVTKRKRSHQEKKRIRQEAPVNNRKFIVENNEEENSQRILTEQPIPGNLKFNAPGRALNKKSGFGRRRPHIPGRFKE